MSPLEIDYIVVISATFQAIWLRRMLAELHKKKKGATEILYDNKATISMAKNITFHNRIKHIGIWFYFFCDMVAKGYIILKYCSTNEQWVNIFTKALSKYKFIYFINFFGVCNFESRESFKD